LLVEKCRRRRRRSSLKANLRPRGLDPNGLDFKGFSYKTVAASVLLKD